LNLKIFKLNNSSKESAFRSQSRGELVPRSTVYVPGARAEERAVVVKTYIVSPSPSSLLRLHHRHNVNQSAALTTSFSSPLVPCDGSGAQPHGCAAMFSCLCAGLRAVELSPHDGLKLLGHSCPCACRRRAIMLVCELAVMS
jgi:hypothetical protein